MFIFQTTHLTIYIISRRRTLKGATGSDLTKRVVSRFATVGEGGGASGTSAYPQFIAIEARQRHRLKLWTIFTTQPIRSQ